MHLQFVQTCIIPISIDYYNLDSNINYIIYNNSSYQPSKLASRIQKTYKYLYIFLLIFQNCIPNNPTHEQGTKEDVQKNSS